MTSHPRSLLLLPCALIPLLALVACGRTDPERRPAAPPPEVAASDPGAPPDDDLDGGDQRPVVIRSQHTEGEPGMQFLTFADREGVFDAADVTWEQTVDERSMPPGVRDLRGDAIVLGTIRFLREAANRPGRYQAMAFAVQDRDHPTNALVVPAASTLAHVSQLATRTPAAIHLVGGGPTAPIWTVDFLGSVVGAQQASRLRLIECGPRDLDLQPWELALVNEPQLSSLLESGRARMLVDGPLYADRLGAPWVIAVVAVSSSLRDRRPSATRRLADAIGTAVTRMNQEPELLRRIFLDHLRTIPEYEKLSSTRLANWLTADRVDVRALQRQVDWLAANGLIPPGIDAGQTLYRP